MKTMVVVGMTVCVLGVIGWISNIFTLINHINDPITPMAVLRVVGIFAAPLGAILGFY